MAHWRLTPEQIKALSPDELEVMEFSFLLLERRQGETLDNLIGGMLGTSWDASSLLGGDGGKEGEKPKSKKDFTWAFREKAPRVHLPLSLALNQNPKFMQHLKGLASNAVNVAREDPSVVNAPTWVNKKSEVVDLSYASKEEFMRFASRFVH